MALYLCHAPDIRERADQVNAVIVDAANSGAALAAVAAVLGITSSTAPDTVTTFSARWSAALVSDLCADATQNHVKVIGCVQHNALAGGMKRTPSA